MSARLGRMEPAAGMADTVVRRGLGHGAAHVLGASGLGLRRRSLVSSERRPIDAVLALQGATRFGNSGGQMKPSVANILLAIVVVALGIAIAAGVIYVGDTDDAPGASLAG